MTKKLKKPLVPRPFNYRVFYKKFMLPHLIFQDMMLLMHIWRQIKGYSSNGQRSHTNNKNNKKVKLVNSFRMKQFNKIFGKKKITTFAALIIAEYTNRLWFYMWFVEWLYARLRLRRYAIDKVLKRRIRFDPYSLSKNIISGLNLKKKKKKM